MSASIHISTLAHAQLLAMKVNRKDTAEIKASSGREPLEMLLCALEVCPKCYTLINDDEPVAMLGAAPDEEDTVARLWMLSSDITPIKSFFLYSLPHLIDELGEGYTMLWNYIDARQRERIEWLHRLGFEFSKEMHSNTSKVPFYKFWKFGSGGLNV